MNVPQSWPDDPREGDAFLDWGAHACDATRWLTGAEAVRMYADYDNFTGTGGRAGPHGARADPAVKRRDRADPALLRDRAVRLRDAPKQRSTTWSGTKGSVFLDLDRCELWTGATDRTIWELPSWTLPDFKPRDPRRIGNTSRQIVDFIDDVAGRPGRRASPGEDGREGHRDDPGRPALGEDRTRHQSPDERRRRRRSRRKPRQGTGVPA